MTVHVRVPAEGSEWEYEIGQCVTHNEQPLPSLVMGRTAAIRRDGSVAMRIYAVRSFMFEDRQRDRMIVAGGLRRVVPGEADCGLCMLSQTGLCPGLRDD